MFKYTGLQAEGLEACSNGGNNGTVFDCPQGKQQDKDSFIVVVHNQMSYKYNHLIRIKLPSRKYMPMAWSKTERKFKQLLNYDIIE